MLASFANSDLPVIKNQMTVPFLPTGYIFPWKNDDLMGIRTHSRYVVNIYKLILGNKLIFDFGSSLKYSNLKNEQKILKKLEIVKYTLNSIKSENGFAQQDSDFQTLALSWLWIKGYYSLFHLTSLLISYEKNDDRYATDREYNSHIKILSIINEIIVSKRPFNIDHFNDNYSGFELNAFKTTNNVNLRNVVTFDGDLFKLSLKKVYSEDVKTKLKDLRGSKRAGLLLKINQKRYCIFDLFHYYRERFNYSGFQYLDCDGMPYNFQELNKFYVSSYTIITLVSTSMVDYLIKKTSGEINKKLIEIKQIL